MGTLVISYFSGNRHTARLAETIAAAAVESGCDTRLVDVAAMTEADWLALDTADAILFGTPTYMGSAAAEFKSFMDQTSDRWTDQVWADKLAAGFTVATFPGGDKLATLIQLTVFAAQHGMIWVGQDQIGAPVDAANPGINASGAWLGLTATSSRDKTLMVQSGDLETARRFGGRIARAVHRWSA
ncbi:NAD(P)H dehydrogenase (quinone) [Thalassovita gelatinovora]|uniref:NAD(P)H dehydrogenase (Quinone) n=1 Tax=Thalassovita gelatinovora TaxID=53501 RepID=A0A0P1FDA0_THAGE|nr:flavodoxin family protein [Thalassovita gelatinovora]QIZ81402.1 flavodoxin family protein [Thalassovita gelatinovora]CUH66176.1 NAD(P)H dehydrogenase (quinone) [Thalassovita gelatinovora]SEQ21191.1 NAD(P)H dehydrogenase (quinone) [Thalassovita gelatinovora]